LHQRTKILPESSFPLWSQAPFDLLKKNVFKKLNPDYALGLRHEGLNSNKSESFVIEASANWRMVNEQNEAKRLI